MDQLKDPAQAVWSSRKHRAVSLDWSTNPPLWPAQFYSLLSTGTTTCGKTPVALTSSRVSSLPRSTVTTALSLK